MAKYIIMLSIPLAALGFLYFQLDAKNATFKSLDFSSMQINGASTESSPIEIGRDGQETENSGEVYRWKDADGNWQFSDKAPEGINYQTEQLSSDINQIQSINRQAKRPEITPAATSATDSPYIDGGLPIPSPEKIQKLMQDAKNVEQLLKQRQETLDSKY